MNIEDDIKWRLFYEETDQNLHVYDPYRNTNILKDCNRVVNSQSTTRQCRKNCKSFKKQKFNQEFDKQQNNCSQLKKVLKNLQTLPSPKRKIFSKLDQQQNKQTIFFMPNYQNTTESENIDNQIKESIKFQISKEKFTLMPSRLLSENSQKLVKSKQISESKGGRCNSQIRVRQLIKRKYTQKQSLKSIYKKQNLITKQNFGLTKDKIIKNCVTLSLKKINFRKLINILQ